MNHKALVRVLAARHVTVVGASEGRPMSDRVVQNLWRGGLSPTYVNPSGRAMYGSTAHRQVSDVDGPIDLAIVMTRADLVPEVIAQCRSVQCAGAIVVSSGFEGPDGAGLSRDLRAAAGDLPLIGPNCTGFVNLLDKTLAYCGPIPDLRPGGVGLVSHSGALLTHLAIGLAERKLPAGLLLAAGNETVTPIAAVIEAMITDDRIDVVGLVVEADRHPGDFLAAVDRARVVGKPVVCLKLGRSRRAAAIAQSHTGALAGDSLIFDAAMRSAGVLLARDLEELLDYIAPFAQLSREFWSNAQRPAVLTFSGGAAGLSADLAEDEGVELPAFDELAAHVATHYPGITTTNPLDMTGYGLGEGDEVRTGLQAYSNSSADVLGYAWVLSKAAGGWGDFFVDPVFDFMPSSRVPLILCSVDETDTVDVALGTVRNVALARGLRGMVRAFKALQLAAVARALPNCPRGASPRASLPEDTSKREWTYAQAVALLAANGIPHVETTFVQSGDANDSDWPHESRYVVKLADAAHRSDLGGVRVAVAAGEVNAAVADMRALAAGLGNNATVAVQPMVDVASEVFVGVRSATPYGPVVLVGIGGIFVELLQDVSARLGPVTPEMARTMIDELRFARLLTGFRGGPSWDLDALADLVSRASVAAAAIDNLDSFELNPLVLSAGGDIVAVDAKITTRDG